MTRPSLGILTGISWVSGMDYFKGINEILLANTPVRHIMSPNPEFVMVTVDCDEYGHHLNRKDWTAVEAHLKKGVARLVAAGCDLLVIASNTGHIGVPAFEREWPHLGIVHIADCLALELGKSGPSRVGLIGTKPTMEEDYLKDRLARHGIETLVPEEEAVQVELYDIICQELSYNVFKDNSRDRMVAVIRGLEARGAGACILGCTEIELLVKPEHVPGLPLLPSAEIHIRATADVLLGRIALADLLPPVG